MTPFEQFKNREYLGDLLLELIVSDILLERGVKRNDVSIARRPFVTNLYLESIFRSMSLQLDPVDISYGNKFMGNAVEEHLWTTFKEKGYEHTKAYFKAHMDMVEPERKARCY